MLVLTRKVQQQIHIGDSITVTILSLRGGRVQVGITAPSSMRVLRGELAPLPKAPGVPLASTRVPAAPPRAAQTTAAHTMPAPGDSPQAHGHEGQSRSGGPAEPVEPAPDGAKPQRVPAKESPLAKAVAQRTRAPLVRPPQRLGAASMGWLAAPRPRG